MDGAVAADVEAAEVAAHRDLAVGPDSVIFHGGIRGWPWPGRCGARAGGCDTLRRALCSSRRAQTLRSAPAASAHSAASGFVDTTMSCSRRMAAMNRPISGAASTGLISGNARALVFGFGHVLLPRLEQVVGGRDRRQQRQHVVDDRVRVIGGDAGDRVARHHDAVGLVHRVHHEVGDGEVHRDADGDDRRHPEIAQDGVEVGAAHRADAVPSAQHEIAWRRTEFGQQLGALGARGDGDLASEPSPIAKILALWLPPSPSGRRWTRQCTTFTPASLAAGSSRSMFGRASRRASSARTASPAFGPTTAPWHSWVTIAVCAGAASSARSILIRDAGTS